jgi:hypothetical protein
MTSSIQVTHGNDDGCSQNFGLAAAAGVAPFGLNFSSLMEDRTTEPLRKIGAESAVDKETRFSG